MKRLFGMGLGMAWATAAVAAAEPDAPKPLFFPSGKPVFPVQKPADKPAKPPASGVTQAVHYSPTSYGSFNGGTVQQATPATPPPATIVRTQATVPVPAPMPAVKPTPAAVTAAKPAPAPVMMAPAPTPTPTYTVLPAVSPVVPQAKPISPLLAANATGYPVTPTVPAPSVAPTSYQAAPMPMAAPPAPVPTPTPTPLAPTPAFAPATVAADCGSCQTGCDSRGFLARFRDWLCYKPCPPIAPKCVPAEYHAPLMAYFPCKPVPAPNYQCCDTGRRKLLGTVRDQFAGCDIGCEPAGCAPCTPCGGNYPTVVAWWKDTFGSFRRGYDASTYGCATAFPIPAIAPAPAVPAPAVVPVPAPMPAATPNAQTTSAPPSADWLAGYRYAVANAGRNPMKNTAPTVLPADPARTPPAAATQTPANMAGQPQFQFPQPPKATPVSVTQPFTAP